MEELVRLAELIRRRNVVTREISAVIDRPALIGHIGEFIASKVFEISLEASASKRAIDGYFKSGPLVDSSVNIKCYGKREGILDITPAYLPDYYLVLTGPKSTTMSSRGTVRPWIIKSAYIFDASELVKKLSRRGIKIGTATSIRQVFWNEAEVYPVQSSSQLKLTDEQRSMLALFGDYD